MRKIKHCKVSMLWLKVKKILIFPTCLKLWVVSAWGLALFWCQSMPIRNRIWIGIKTMPIHNAVYKNIYLSNVCTLYSVPVPLNYDSDRGWFLFFYRNTGISYSGHVPFSLGFSTCVHHGHRKPHFILTYDKKNLFLNASTVTCRTVLNFSFWNFKKI